ncbi:MAG: hypothetical protein HY780_15405 [Chloroflexi bacterium]|nr:hypothetical protein [Chloroflexota bacterium]
MGNSHIANCWLGAAVIAGLIAFQKGSRTTVEGYLDTEQKIAYAGGLLAESADDWHTTVSWRRAYPTQADLDYYVSTSRQVGKQLLDEGVDQFFVGVTLRNYIPLEAFDQFADEMGIQVKGTYIRGTFPTLDPTEKITFAGVPASGKLNDPETIKHLKANLKSQAREMKADKLAVKKTGNPDADAMEELEPEEIKAITADDSDFVLNGIYAFAGAVDAKGYRRLLKDKRVYNVDVTATVVYQRLKGGGMSWKDFADKVQLIGYKTFADMERMGLDKFQVK